MTFLRGHLSLLALTVVLLVAAGSTVLAAETSTTGDSLAVNYVDTPVKFRPAGQTDWKDLPDTATMLPDSGDLLVEDEGGLGLESGDSTAINLNEQSGLSFRLANDTADQFRLNHGSLKTTVEEDGSDRTELKLETPMGSLGIRGTEFGVSYERSGRSEVFVDTGNVVLKTDAERQGVAPGDYVAFGSEKADERSNVLKESSIPDRYRLTWSRFNLRKRLVWLRKQRDQLRERVQSDAGGATELKAQLKNLTRAIKRIKERYQPLNDRYQAYRERLEERRDDFIKQRKQALDEYRKRRLKEMRELEEERERGIEEMRRRREEAMNNMGS